MLLSDFNGLPPHLQLSIKFTKSPPTSLLVHLSIAGRWKIIIISHLHEHDVIRLNELLRMVPRVSKGVFTRQLRELEEDGIVHREVYKMIPPKVEYSFREQGIQFQPVLEAIRTWGKTIVNND